MTRFHRRHALALATLAAGSASLAGCSSSAPAASASSGQTIARASITPPGSTTPGSTTPGSATPRPTASGAAPGTPPRTSASDAEAAAAIAKVALVDRDLANGATFTLIPGGDTVKGQSTLDNCGYRFTSEANRRARRQTGMLTAKGQRTGVSNEVVAYDSPAHAAQALAQWKESVKRCRFGTDIPLAVAGRPVVRYDTQKVQSEPRLPVRANAVTFGRMTVKSSGTKLYTVAVIQQRGPVLDAVWLVSSASPPAAEIDAVLGLAVVTGKRLAAL